VTEQKKALALLLQDREGRDLGGFIILDQGHRRLSCDWLGVCTNQAIIAIVPSVARAAPQLACGSHAPNMFLSIWRNANPPRLLVKDGSRLLAKNDQVSS